MGRTYDGDGVSQEPTDRRIAATQQFGRERGKVDVGGSPINAWSRRKREHAATCASYRSSLEFFWKEKFISPNRYE
jgi:hypothetical protein